MKWFDPTINLGHLITIIAILSVGVAGWNDLRKSVTVLEEARIMQRQLYQSRVVAVDVRLTNLEADARDLRARVDQFSDKKGK